jgi:hypothetical protein
LTGEQHLSRCAVRTPWHCLRAFSRRNFSAQTRDQLPARPGNFEIFSMIVNVARTLIVFAALASVAQAQPQTWPSRPLKLVVSTGPGAATDVMARLLGDALSRKIGQPVVVENMPGASGILAHQAVARASPDGHTLLFTNTSGMASISFPSSLCRIIPSETSQRLRLFATLVLKCCP